MRSLIETTLEQCERIFEQYKNPALLVSFGKDSTALLHLLLHFGLPVICHRPSVASHKWSFADRIISDWNLTVFDWPPAYTALQEQEGNLEILTAYGIGSNKTLGIRQAADQVEDYNGICGLRDFLQRPCGTIQHPWDLLISAQKNGDTDHFGGAHEIKLTLKQNPGAADILFPFRNWTDDQVWKYILAEKVPYDTDRYSENEDRTRNPDRIQGCFKCIHRKMTATVSCPRLHGAVINNISSEVPYIEHDPVLC